MKKIVLLLFPAALLFCGCDLAPKKMGKSPIEMDKSPIEAEGSILVSHYEGCEYLRVVDGGKGQSLTHSATCQNPKHTCCGYRYCNDTLQ